MADSIIPSFMYTLGNFVPIPQPFDALPCSQRQLRHQYSYTVLVPSVLRQQDNRRESIRYAGDPWRVLHTGAISFSNRAQTQLSMSMWIRSICKSPYIHQANTAPVMQVGFEGCDAAHIKASHFCTPSTLFVYQMRIAMQSSVSVPSVLYIVFKAFSTSQRTPS
jgi:hypothetical protein